MKPILSLQLPGQRDRYEDFHRVECGSMKADDLHAALDRIIAEPATTRIPKVKTGRWRERTAHRPDGEVMPGA
jgi:hypothetical protein